jgi:hypothetical protein
MQSTFVLPAGGAGGKLPFWTRGDLNAFFGLGINMLVNVLVLAGLAVILPALGVELLIGNVFYFYLAKRLATKEGRTDVAAMPYGPSVPHMFIVTFVIMLPTYLQTKDPVKAWEAGIAWAFIIGLIILAGAFVGPYVRKFTPRAALLGTLAGISITFISMRPAAQMWDAAWIALPVLSLILIGFVSGVRLPGNVPMGVVALGVGTAIAWIGGFMDGGAVSDGVNDIAVGLPSLDFGRLANGLDSISPLLATAIPLGIYNFMEAMSNVESAAAAGDKYNLRAVLLADGTGAIVGACAGCPFPPAVYIGQLLACHGRRDLRALRARLLPAARRVPADPGDRPDPVVHRLGHRRAVVPGGAEGLLPGDRHRDGAEHRVVGCGAGRQRAGGGRDERRAGRLRQAVGGGHDLRRDEHARPGRRPGRHDAGRDHGVHHRPPVHLGGVVLRLRRRAHVGGVDPQHGGACVQR